MRADAGLQCFPLYRYEQQDEAQEELFDDTQSLKQVDNITDTTLRRFRVHYNDNTISKDRIFDDIYGVLHAPVYRARFANDLSKELPRVPMAPDFDAFANAGSELAALHLGYETCEEYPLEIEPTHPGELRPEHYRIGTRAMRYSDNEKTLLIVTQDKESRIVNDPNGWFNDPQDLITAIRRIVHVSVETVRIVAGLPESIGLDME